MGRRDAAEPLAAAEPESCAPAIEEHAAIGAFRDVAAALSDLQDLDTLLHLIAKRICELAAAPRCSVYLRDEETGLFRGQVGHADADIDAGVKRLVAGLEADGFTHEIVETKRPVIVTDALLDPRPIRSTMQAWNVRAMAGVPMVLRGDVIGIVFLDAPERRCAFTDETIRLASTFADLAAVAISQAQMTGELRKSLGTVARQNRLLRRAHAVDDRLGSLALDGAGFGDIAKAVADLTGKPCAIYNAAHHPLAGATPSWMEGTGAPRLPDGATWGSAEVQTAVAALDATQEGVLRPIPSLGLRHRLLIAPVTSRECQWGSLVVMEHGTRFSSLDVHIAQRAATHIALEMAAERRAARAEWDARASLLGDLIRGNRDIASVERRAQYLGTDLSTPRVVCLIGAGRPGDSLPSAAEVSAALVRAGHGQALVVGVTEGVLVGLDLELDLPSREAVAAATALIEQVLDTMEAGTRLAAGVSAVCREWLDYPRAYSEARQVLTCLTTRPCRCSPRMTSARPGSSSHRPIGPTPSALRGTRLAACSIRIQ
jgi:GAF domain-containing protein